MKQSAWPICGQTRRVDGGWGGGGLAGVLTQEGAPGRQAGIWHSSNHTRPQRLTAGAARCMKSHCFTQRRWTAGDAAAIFNPRPPSRTERTAWIVVLSLSLSSLCLHAEFCSKLSYSPFETRCHLRRAKTKSKLKCPLLLFKGKKSFRRTESFLFNDIFSMMSRKPQFLSNIMK